MRRLVALFILLILCGCGGSGGSSSSGNSGGGTGNVPIPPDVTLSRVEVSPAQTQLPLGISLPLHLFAVYSNGARVDVSDASNWVSTSNAVVMTGSSARGAMLGNSQIIGTFQGQSGTAQIEVTAAQMRSLTIEPGQAQVAAGLSQPFRVFATFSDNSRLEVTDSASWAIVDVSVAQLEATAGVVRGLRPGVTQVQANLSNQQASAQITVTAAQLTRVELTPASLTLPAGLTQNFSATGYLSDGSHRDVTADCSWSSTVPEVFFVSNFDGSKGQGGSLMVGNCQVSARLGTLSASCPVTITEAVLQTLTVEPADANLPIGLSQVFQATGNFSDGSHRTLTQQVVWSSSAGDVASISNAPGSTGLARGIGAGSTQIQARLGDVHSQVTLTVVAAVLQSIEVSPSGRTLPNGLTEQFSAYGRYSDGDVRNISSMVLWSTSNPARASVDGSGLVTATGQGTVEVQAELTGVHGATLLTVSDALLQSLLVTPAEDSLPNGASRPFTATGLFSDTTSRNLTEQVTWSTDGSVAEISNQDGSRGLATGKNLGNATILAELNGIQAVALLHVTAAAVKSVDFEPGNFTIPKGTFVRAHILVRYTDGSSVDVTNQTASGSFPLPSSPSVVMSSVADNTVSVRTDVPTQVRNILYGTGVGTTQVQVTTPFGSGSTTVTVSPARLASLEVAPNGALLQAGQAQELTALGHYGDGTVLDLTEQALWTSLKAEVATVSNADGQQGLLTAVADGEATIQASFGGATGSTVVSVGKSALVGKDWIERIGVGPYMFDLAYGNGIWVSTDGGGRVNSSPDGRNWRGGRLLPGNSGEATGLAFGDGVFLAFAGNNTVVSSSDGRVWTPMPVAVDSPSPIGCIAFGNHRFLAIRLNREVLASDDGGQSWTSLGNPGAGGGLLEFANGKFFLLRGVPRVSSDGSNWTSLNTGSFVAYSIAYDGTRYVLVGKDGKILTSTDLVNFTPQTASAATDDFVRVVHGAGRFVAVTYLGDKFASTNGVNWTPVSQRSSTVVRYGRGFMAAAEDKSPSKGLQLSDDGQNWQHLTSLNPDFSISDSCRVGYGPLGFMVNGLRKVYLSLDGLVWNSQATSGINTQDFLIRYLGGHYYTQTATSLNFLRSDDGLAYYTVLLANNGSKLVFGNGRYVLADPIPHGSIDGFTFTPLPGGTLQGHAGAFGGGRFVLVGDRMTAYSDDGINFTSVSNANTYVDVEYAFGQFVAFTNSKIFSSSDGIVWVDRTPTTPGNILVRGICVGNGQAIAYGEGLISSTDGINWTRLQEGVFTIHSMAAGAGKFVGTTLGAGVLTSP